MFDFVLIIVIFLFSAILHEISHGWMANYLGDSTAKTAGRLSLNPIRHLDFFGSIVLPLVLILMRSGIVFGWAKPVPINPLNLKPGRFSQAKVALAGPLSNIIIAVIFGLALRFAPLAVSEFSINLAIVFSYIVWVNLLLAVFNLAPIPPLDGSHILFALLPREFDNIKMFLSQYGLFILIFFIFFLFRFLVPIINLLFSLIVGQPFI